MVDMLDNVFLYRFPLQRADHWHALTFYPPYLQDLLVYKHTAMSTKHCLQQDTVFKAIKLSGEQGEVVCVVVPGNTEKGVELQTKVSRADGVAVVSCTGAVAPHVVLLHLSQVASVLL